MYSDKSYIEIQIFSYFFSTHTQTDTSKKCGLETYIPGKVIYYFTYRWSKLSAGVDMILRADLMSGVFTPGTSVKNQSSFVQFVLPRAVPMITSCLSDDKWPIIPCLRPFQGPAVKNGSCLCIMQLSTYTSQIISNNEMPQTRFQGDIECAHNYNKTWQLLKAYTV